MIGPDGPFRKAMIQRSSDAGFSASLLNQEIAALLIDQHFTGQLDSVNLGYRTKALQVMQWLNEYLGPYLEHVTGGQAGFYYYLTFKILETHEASPLFKFLTRTTGDPVIDGGAKNISPRVLYIPGVHFTRPSHEPSALSRRQCRISYGYEEPAQLEKALELFGQGCHYAYALL